MCDSDEDFEAKVGLRCNGASEDAAAVLSTRTRDGSPDRGVTIKMSRQ